MAGLPAQARPSLGELAQRIEPGATWDDLVLPPAQLAMLRQIAAQVRHRAAGLRGVGLRAAGARGLGISALFAGASGTGKTMAAEVLANDLQLDLYRIDLSQVVSKYIGETEKNLRRVFDAAEGGGAILLFDEADALFGKRSEVKDSHDRYANIEISYLLQRMEAYRGLAILTTNQRSALDPAFLRRLRFIVEFPFPDAAMRAEIWRRVFPRAHAHRRDSTLDKLARLNVAGGNIRNIALNAAFLAADADEPVRMAHLLRAARTRVRQAREAPDGVRDGGLGHMSRRQRGPARGQPNRPEAVEVAIDELVLHGFDARDRLGIADAVQAELARLLAEPGAPVLAGPARAEERLDAGAVSIIAGASARDIGAGIAGAVLRSLTQGKP